MGSIQVNVKDNGNGLTMSASPNGCGGWAAGCRWKEAAGPVKLAADSKITVNAVFTSCPEDGAAASSTTTLGSLDLATNGRNVFYW